MPTNQKPLIGQNVKPAYTVPGVNAPVSAGIAGTVVSAGSDTAGT